jgi:hypothetical protein
MKRKKLFLLLSICFFTVNAGHAESGNPSIDLSPARWIWYPSGRTLQNTFVLFRKEINIEKEIKSATGWILADSRYQLYVNGKRVQWGPAPSDPRWQEADPVDLKDYLKPGKNVIASQVCFFGSGDGTTPMGKPGFLFKLEIDGQEIVSDNTWQCHLARSWKPGQYKRWFLRSLQEEFDARLFPYGWDDTSFIPDNSWINAREISSSGNKPSICSDIYEYMWEISGNAQTSQLRPRSIPMMNEYNIPASKLTESKRISWKMPVEDYFDMIVPGSYEAENTFFRKTDETKHSYEITPEGEKAASLVFEFEEQGVGWPYFTINAPEGTIVELLVHEGHKPDGPAVINSHFNAWTRFICKEGTNNFETFDFESFRWIQLHIRNFDRPVKVHSVGMRRRIYPWKNKPEIVLSDDTLQAIMYATVNTLNNSAQETVVDGMARERQQYSGDGAHQLHSVYQTFGEYALPKRFVNIFSQGSSLEGYFMDSWPAWDRLARIPERQMQLTKWGPLIDHGVGFCFDSHYYYLYTGDKEGLNDVYPRLIKFFHYITSLTDESDHLIPSEDLGVCSVFMDHDAYKKNRHKQLALNLYIAAMCKHALLPLCRLFNDNDMAEVVESYGEQTLQSCIKKFWCNERKIFINNLPWIKEEGEIRYCDRSLATAVLYNQCPDNNDGNALKILAGCPKEMGLSYPCNAVWRLWALAEKGQIDIVLDDLCNRWSEMISIWENNVVQETWQVEYDSNSQWSHCAVAPLVMLHQGIAGVIPLDPETGRYRVRPQVGRLSHAKFDIQTIYGPIAFESKGTIGNRDITLNIPEGCEVELWLDAREKVKCTGVGKTHEGLKKYILKEKKVKFKLKYS